MEDNKDLTFKVKELKDKFMHQANDFFSDAAISFFRKYKNLQSFGWTQIGYYDNDEFVFTPNIKANTIFLNDKNIYDIEYENLNNDYINELIKDIEKYKDDKEISKVLKSKLKETEDIVKSKILTLEEAEKITFEIEKFLSMFSKSDYEVMFGNKSLKITIYRDERGVKIEDI